MAVTIYLRKDLRQTILGGERMAFVETEIHDQIMVIRLNRPDRLNALSTVMREGMGEAFTALGASWLPPEEAVSSIG